MALIEKPAKCFVVAVVVVVLFTFILLLLFFCSVTDRQVNYSFKIRVKKKGIAGSGKAVPVDYG